MTVTHYAITCKDRETADTFFHTLLGMTLSRTFRVSSELSKTIFSIEREVEVLVFEDATTRFEVFLAREGPQGFAHIGLEVPNVQEFLDRCRRLGFPTVAVPKGDKTLFFVRDPSGNLFEVTAPRR